MPRGSDVEGSPWAPGLYALALAFWASSWNLRNSVIMAWLPVEPTVVGAAGVLLCVIHRLGQPLRLPTAGVIAGALLVVGFLPGAVLSSTVGYGQQKVLALVGSTLPMTVAAFLLLSSVRARRAWLWGQGVVGAAVVVAALRFNDAAAILRTDRFTLASVDTISSGRYAGVVMLILVMVALARPKRWWWLFLPALVAGTVAVRVGSRGPVLFAVVSVLLVLLSAKAFAGRRALSVCGAVAAILAVFAYALRHGGSGAIRILDSAHEGFADGTRSSLLEEASSLGLTHPWGIGWGNFAQFSSTGRELSGTNGDYYAHNTLAEAFSEGGWLALLVFVAVIATAVFRSWRLASTPAEAAVFGTLLYWVLNAQVSFDLTGNRFMWCSLACALAALIPSAPDQTVQPRTKPNARQQE